MGKRIVVIGGGAAGFFSAINIAEKHPDYSVTILEKGNKVLSKVKVSGEGVTIKVMYLWSTVSLLST